MTQNQIAYHNAKELERHNQATETENQRHSMREEELKMAANRIAEQSNVITREHYERMDSINATHYANQDAYNRAALAEQQRSNLASEAIRAQQNAINAAAVAETARHQRTTEGIESTLAANTIYKSLAEVSQMSANASYLQSRVDETKARTSNVKADTNLKNTQNTMGVIQMGWANKQARSQYELTRSQTDLNVVKAQTEHINQFVGVTQGTKNITGVFKDWNEMIQSWMKVLVRK